MSEEKKELNNEALDNVAGGKAHLPQTTLRCPKCGKEFNVSIVVKRATCPFCGEKVDTLRF